MITREKIEERLKLLEMERDKTLANLNAYTGAIEECQFWLSEFDKKEEEE